MSDRAVLLLELEVARLKRSLWEARLPYHLYPPFPPGHPKRAQEVALNNAVQRADELLLRHNDLRALETMERR